MPRSSSAALPTAYVVLRILIVLNWLVGAAFLALLVVAPNEQWIMTSYNLSPSPEAERLIFGLRVIVVLLLAMIPLNHVVLKRLRAIVETVRAGDPFVTANAYRLRAIAWALLAAQLRQQVPQLDRFRIDPGPEQRIGGGAQGCDFRCRALQPLAVREG